MLMKAATAALALALVTPAFAQEPTPIDLAILTCIGPGFTPEGDPFEVLDNTRREVMHESVQGVRDGL
jgi:hypothetical protein